MPSTVLCQNLKNSILIYTHRNKIEAPHNVGVSKGETG
jgi:hypothetical protein